MIKVEFNDVDEFFEEATKEVGVKVMRVTIGIKKASGLLGTMSFTNVGVHAGFVNVDGYIVELFAIPEVSDLKGNDPQPFGSLFKAAEGLAEKIRGRATELGYDVRHGRYLDALHDAG